MGKVPFDRDGDTSMTGDLATPPPLFCVVSQLTNVNELVPQDGAVIGSRSEIVAGLTHVGVGARSRCHVSRTRSVSKSGL